MMRAALTDGVAKQSDAACPDVARDEHAAIAHVAAIVDGLSAGRRAQVEHPLARLGVNGERHELRRFVLHEETARRRACRSGLPLRRRAARPERAPCSRTRRRPQRAPSRTSSRVVRSRLARSVSGAGRC